MRVRRSSYSASLTSNIGVQAGAIFVNQSATEYLNRLFLSAGLKQDDVDEYTREGIESFESEVKKAFEGAHEEDVSLQVGWHKFTEKSIGVKRGILTIARYVLLFLDL